MTRLAPKEADPTPRATLVVHAGYEAFVLLIALIMLVNSVLLVLPVSADTRSVAWVMNTLLGAFLVLDAFYRFLRRKNRFHWLFRQYGWLIALGSLPAPFFSLGRLLAVRLSLRRLQKADLEAVGVNIVRQRAQSALLGVLLVAILVFELASIFILQAESASPDANIRTASDALWWGYVTVATVGYGDRYPVTTNGRLVGIAVMTIGVAIFSVLTSFLADWFRRPRTAKHRGASGTPEGDDVHALIVGLRHAIEEKAQADQAALEELRDRLDQIERRLE